MINLHTRRILRINASAIYISRLHRAFKYYKLPTKRVKMKENENIETYSSNDKKRNPYLRVSKTGVLNNHRDDETHT